MKALPINVFKTPTYSGCSNGGITERFDKLLLLCDEGFVDVDESNPPENLVKIVTRYFGSREYKHIEPVASTAPGCVGWMSGGAVAYTCDSRFSKMSEYPLCVHDRQETQAQYDAMFN